MTVGTVFAWRRAMLHLTARALDGTLLFHDWTEALELWRRMIQAFPDARAMCLMPNHPHVLVDDPAARARMTGLMSGFARWRGHRRQQEGGVWQRQPAVVEVPEGDHARRTIRYVLLNPCRGGLVDDPLGWPLSLHRDLVGLGDPARKVRDPTRFHRYISSDPTVSLVGSELPGLGAGPARLDTIEAAVGAVLKMQPAELRQSAAARRLMIRAAWFRENTDATQLAEWVGTSRTAVYRFLGEPPKRAQLGTEPWLSAVLRVIDDPRFGPLVLRPRANPTRWDGWRL